MEHDLEKRPDPLALVIEMADTHSNSGRISISEERHQGDIKQDGVERLRDGDGHLQKPNVGTKSLDDPPINQGPDDTPSVHDIFGHVIPLNCLADSRLYLW